MKYLPLLAFVVLASCAAPTRTAIEPKGEFATIKVEDSNQEVRHLMEGDRGAVARVTANPGAYHPAVLYALSDALVRSGRKDEAVEWFYLGQLRARSDANKAQDPSAKRAVSALNERFGPQINPYAFQDIGKLKATVARVLSKDRTLGRNYDARWIALTGTDAFSSEKVRFAPRSQWKSIDERTRKEYEAGFQEMLKHLPAR
ncbi:MAG: hypothetical protein JWO82_3858 [Akkermansiaceae bacterium]|nr:hypothetical protein [Akkermansiaceae bacterium]